MKMTTPKAILVGSIFITLAILFRVDGNLFAVEAKAEVAGMNSRDLRNDRDFKRAVESIVANMNHSDLENSRNFTRAVEEIVEDCKVRDSNISC